MTTNGADLFSLQGKVALVIGGSAGIGQAAAGALTALGAQVIIASRNAHTGERAAAEMGAAHVRLDVTDSASVDSAVAAVIERMGRLDIAVNGAGAGLNKPTEETEDGDFTRVVEVNFGGIFRCCRAEGRVMLRQGSGSIINVASMSAFVVNHPQRQAIYNASKAAVVHYTRSLAVEWADRGLRVNSVSPGITETAMTAKGRAVPGRLALWQEKTPLGRIAKPQDIAGAIAYLASDASAFATGTDILIDGGYGLW